jgi:hypothetical protein
MMAVSSHHDFNHSRGPSMMRRSWFLSLGFLEFAVAGLVAYFGFQLPTGEDISQSFERAERVTNHAGIQVGLLRKQVQGLRRVRLDNLAQSLEAQTRAVTGTLRAQAVDFDTVSTIRDALGGVSTGLDNLAQTLDTESISRLGTALGETADFLADKVVPAAKTAADRLDASSEHMRADAELLSNLLKESPPDFKVLREIHASLGHFRNGIHEMTDSLQLARAETMREGFQGLETSLETGAEQVEKLAGYTYPSVSFSGLRPTVAQNPFWPEGKTIAEGMRKAASGTKAAADELNSISAQLPGVRKSLVESGKVVDKVREALGLALQYQSKIEPILKEMPAHASKLAEDLPRLSGDLSRLLRDTGRLKEVATGLRQAQKGIDDAVENWPETQATLSRLAIALRATRNQLDQAVRHRKEYEAAMRETVNLAETFVALLPMITDQFEGRLDEEERTLSALGGSIEEVENALPAYSQTAGRLTQTGRLLAWLVAVIVGLHASYLVLGTRVGRRYAW